MFKKTLLLSMLVFATQISYNNSSEQREQREEAENTSKEKREIAIASLTQMIQYFLDVLLKSQFSNYSFTQEERQAIIGRIKADHRVQPVLEHSILELNNAESQKQNFEKSDLLMNAQVFSRVSFFTSVGAEYFFSFFSRKSTWFYKIKNSVILLSCIANIITELHWSNCNAEKNKLKEEEAKLDSDVGNVRSLLARIVYEAISQELPIEEPFEEKIQE